MQKLITVQRRTAGIGRALPLYVVLAFVWSCESAVVQRVTVSPGTASSDAAPDAADASMFDASNDAAPTASCDAEVCARCGDSKRDVGEECDDGNQEDGDGCSASCERERGAPPCGDGIQAVEEECDDGNLVSGDGCDDHCRAESCGNLRTDANEECDPPVAEQCDATCKRVLPNCGDGEVQADEGEHCDDVNDERGDGCHRCRFECGNARLERDIGEECEPVFALEGTCNAETCKRLPACGNGKVEESAGEECDPSNGVTCVSCQIRTPPPVDGGYDSGTVCVPSAPPIVELRNGGFDSDAAHWTARARVTTAHSTEGADMAGSLRTSFAALDGGDGGYEISGTYQCVTVAPGSAYLLRLKYRIQNTAPTEVAPSLTLREYQNADCTGASAALSGPALGNMRGDWVEREGMVGVGPTARALFVQLSIVKPRNVEGVVLWDDIELESSSSGARCGNCIIDESQNENCDDGNHEDGDGCDASCRLEGCGDGVDDPSEDCDDGAQLFGDAADLCTPSCRTKSACDTCAAQSCDSEIDPCLNLEGEATGGPGKGIARAALCDALRNCAHETGCSGDTALSARSGFGGGRFLEHCYCGTTAADCFDRGEANGSCRAEVEAALETTDAVDILARVGGSQPSYPAFAALSELLACERQRCETTCVITPECGDGHKQDRTAQFAASYEFHVGTTRIPCDDDLTHTGLGCTFEECDDGNVEGGDGCDADCFVEVCGNSIEQGAEDCDDGNTEGGDGCDGSCHAEFVCGDGIRNEQFEECDPPASGIVCSAAQHAADPSQCACDSECQRTVCGNGVLQAGEQCDPPGPVCNESCELFIDRCTSCISRIEFGGPNSGSCSGDAWLQGIDDFAPGFEQGCLNNEICFDAWNCYRTTQCALNPLGPHVCYCGAVPGDVCEQGNYQPNGPCKDEILAGFEEQFLYPPQSNGEVTASLSSFAVSPGGYAALFVPYDLATFCLVPDGAGLPLRTLLSGNGVTGAELEECIDACFPSNP